MNLILFPLKFLFVGFLKNFIQSEIRIDDS